jgi:plasmid stability protein
MPNLLLRNVPDDLYRRLKATAARHRRSMTQEAILSLQTGLAAPAEPPPRACVPETLAWLEREVWTLPVLDQRDDDEILGYGPDGFCD